MGEACPFALHQQHVSGVELRVYEVVCDVFVAVALVAVAAALHSQYVYSEPLAQVRLADAHAQEVRRGHHHKLRQSEIVEINPHVGHFLQSVVSGEFLHPLLIAYHVERIALVDGASALRHVLVHLLYQVQRRLLVVSNLDDAHPVALLYVQLVERLADYTHPSGGSVSVRSCRHLVSVQVVHQPVFVHEVVERLRLVLLAALLLGKEQLAERHEHDDADGNDDESHGEEREERKRLEASLGQHFVYHEVGRRTDEREHSAQAAGEGERHEQPRCLQTGCCRDTHDDGHHEGHGAGVAHEGSDKRCYYHNEQECQRLVAVRQSHELLSRQLGESRLHYGSAHHEEPHHHDDDGRGEAGQSLCRSKYS